jgi:hypothetical protein
MVISTRSLMIARSTEEFYLLGYNRRFGGDTFLRNVGRLSKDYTVLHARKQKHKYRCENLRTHTDELIMPNMTLGNAFFKPMLYGTGFHLFGGSLATLSAVQRVTALNTEHWTVGMWDKVVVANLRHYVWICLKGLRKINPPAHIHTKLYKGSRGQDLILRPTESEAESLPTRHSHPSFTVLKIIYFCLLIMIYKGNVAPGLN